ncbi:ribosomal protein L11 methyltransferase [Flexibacter flexilis DSM 6793]|uniref:Ribosomal protein L11 methyltransferase n=1 Tax=Flexibacter flexilis DSM 6793 TaxID=927664 RepID=A0A1I1GTL4_9BACT|nr:50S ribosomal protein L11 methyltransferase [Flexibacter flexilis]SFC15127.1 ribosomal protein L11 methyltransferase [Flexibacter flexilis DSM 6793]
MNYIELNIEVAPDFADVLIAELGQVGFDTFTETDNGVQAYAEEKNYDAQAVADLLATYAQQTPISYTTQSIAQQNWNEEWERNFEPVTVGNECFIRATFHEPRPEFKHEIIINPKMSFGTGHHATTALMVEHQLAIPHAGKRVLDAGTGTGILAIMAEKLGADFVEAFDIDEWPVENTRENLQLNSCQKVTVWQGEINGVAADAKFDIVLANINRNILLDQIPAYVQHLTKGGVLLLSGFYEHDIADIAAVAASVGLTEQSRKIRDQWSAVWFA